MSELLFIDKRRLRHEDILEDIIGILRRFQGEWLSKGFIAKQYYRGLREGYIRHYIKPETLYRYLRRLAEEGKILSNKRGYYKFRTF